MKGERKGETVNGIGKFCLPMFLVAATLAPAFAQEKHTVTTDSSSEKRDGGEDSRDHGHRARTVILVSEQDTSGQVHAWWRDPGQPGLGIAGDILKDKLTEKSYEIIDHAAVADVVREHAANAGPELTIDQAKTIGKQVNAEIAIIGKVSSKIKDDHNRMKSGQADIFLKAVWVETGQLIALAMTHASAADADEVAAANNALKQAAVEGADRLFEKMSHFCMEHGSTRSVNITITGLDKLQFMKIKESLKSQVRGVKDFQEQSFSGGTAKISVDCTVSAQALLDELVIIDFGSFALEEVNSTPRKLELKVTPK